MGKAMAEMLRVTKSYRSAFPDRLTAYRDERLRLERRPSEWPGWILCTNSSGKSGWVPEDWVEIKRDFCVLEADYNAAELTIEVAEILTVEFEESGSGWVTKEGRESGWVPLEHLERR